MARLSSFDYWLQHRAILDTAESAREMVSSLDSINDSLDSIDDSLSELVALKRFEVNEQFEFRLFWESLTIQEKKRFLAERDKLRAEQEARRKQEIAARNKLQLERARAAAVAREQEQSEAEILKKQSDDRLARYELAAKTPGTPEFVARAQSEKRVKDWELLRTNDLRVRAVRKLVVALQWAIRATPILGFLAYGFLLAGWAPINFGYFVVLAMSAPFGWLGAILWFAMTHKLPLRFYTKALSKRFRKLHPEHEPFTQWNSFPELPSGFPFGE